MYGGSYYGEGYGGNQPVSTTKIETLTDNFNDNSLDASKWGVIENGGATATEQNGRFEFALPSSGSDADYADLYSQGISYTLEASKMSIHVIEVPNPATAADGDMIFNLTRDGANYIRVVYEAGLLYAQYVADGVRTTIDFMPYDEVAMAYWQLREAGGIIYFETSQDGITFTPFASFDWTLVFASLDNGNVDFECFCYQDETDPGNFIIDDFNIVSTSQNGGSVAFDCDSDMTVVSPRVNTTVNNPLPRTYEYKVFDKDDNFIGIWPDVISDFGYSQDINTAGAAIQVQLGRSIDTPFNDPVRLLTEADPTEHLLTEAGEFLQGDYQSPNRVGEGTDVAVNNRLEVWEYYGSIDDLVTSQDGENIVTSGENIGEVEVADNFDDNSVDISKWSDWGGAFTEETNNQLEMYLDNAGGYHGFDSAQRHDFTDGKMVSVQVVDAGDLGITSWEVYPLSLIGDTTDDQYFWFIGVGNLLRVYRRVGGVQTVVLDITYDPDVHKYLAARYYNGNWLFQYSTDGENWTTAYSEPVGFTPDNILIDILTGTWQAEASNTTAIFDNFNLFYPVGENIQVHYGAPNGRRAFHGIIQDFEADYGNTDTVLVTVASFGIQLDNYVRKIGETTTVPQNSLSPSQVVRNGITDLQSQGGEMGYSQNSIQESGTVASVTFRLNTILEVVKKGIEMAPQDWSWYGDVADDLVYMQARPVAVAHRFILGEHILKAKFKQSILNMINLYYFVGGEQTEGMGDYLFKKYLNQASIDEFGQQLKRQTDQRFTDENSVSLIANSAIDADKNPRYAGTMDISAGTYPIETVRLGQLIGFANHGNFIDQLNLVVANIKYSPDILTVKLEVLPPKVDKRIEDIKRNLTTQEQLNTPDTPS